MPQIIAFEDVKANQKTRRGTTRTQFFDTTADKPHSPVAFLSQGEPGRILKAHWHIVDQFQIIVGGSGKLGRHSLTPYHIHFSRAYTPYGPLVGDSETGMSFFTLRRHFDPGAQYFPESKEVLRQIPNRAPWQTSGHLTFPERPGTSISNGVDLQEVPGVKDNHGLAAYSLVMCPNATTEAPYPSSGDGQYLIIVKGSLLSNSREYQAFTLVFIDPEENPCHLRAGNDGLTAIVANFPKPQQIQHANAVPSIARSLRKWQCELCAFVYDEATGQPSDGLSAGTRWEDVPETWTCPDCSASKNDFRTQ